MDTKCKQGKYTRPSGRGTQYVMCWEDYVKYGFKEDLAWMEDHIIPNKKDINR